MKIGLFTDTFTPQINGVVTVVRMMAREFAALGHEPIVFAPSYPDQPEEPGVRVYRFASRKVNFHPESRLTWPYRRRIPEVLAELDVVHSHTPFSMGLLALWTAKRYGLPHVHTYHTYFSEYRHYIPRPFRPTKRAAERISRAFCDRCDLVLAPSEEMKTALESYGVRTAVEAMPFGIDLEAFARPPRQDVRDALGIPAEAPLLLTAGRLGPEKNFGFLLEATARVLAQQPQAVLVVAGDGPLRNALEAQAAALGLAERVRFTGYLERECLIDAYRQADVFVFASKTETQGIVLLEAQAAGTPVVAVGAMGVLDVVDDGHSGTLVDENPEAFANATLALLEDPALHQRFSQGARSLANANGSAKSCRQLLARYEALRRQPILSH